MAEVNSNEDVGMSRSMNNGAASRMNNSVTRSTTNGADVSRNIESTRKIPSREELHNALVSRHKKPVQDKLDNARVAICGLGGLGSHIAIALARSGVGHLHLIDFDRVDLTNINRQQYAIEELDCPKPEALLKEIRRFAPYIDITTDYVKMTEANITALLETEEYVCEAFDDAEQKAMLTNYILENIPEKILVGASGMAGFGKSNEITTRKIMKNYYLCGDGISENNEECGLMSPRVMICAGHQANKIIELIVQG